MRFLDLENLFTCGNTRTQKAKYLSLENGTGSTGVCASTMPKLKQENVKTVAGFLEGAAVFTISRMWADLISAFVLHLSSVPYCGGFVAEECSGTAPSSALFLYAVCTLPIAGLCKHLVESTGLTKLPGMWDDIPMILNYIVGWAWGNALTQLLVEICTSYEQLAFVRPRPSRRAPRASRLTPRANGGRRPTTTSRCAARRS